MHDEGDLAPPPRFLRRLDLRATLLLNLLVPLLELSIRFLGLSGLDGFPRVAIEAAKADEIQTTLSDVMDRLGYEPYRLP